jgi:hypothetical protein
LRPKRSEVASEPPRVPLGVYEKEDLLVLNEIMAKLNQNEKLIGLGAVVVAVAWVLGLVITDGWYGHSGAQTMGLIAVVAAVGAVVVLYLKYAPGTNITWPAPVSTILLIVAAVAGVLALIGLFQAFTYDPLQGLGGLLGSYAPSKPVTLYLAAGGVAVGAGLMCYAAYMDWTAAKKVV